MKIKAILFDFDDTLVTTFETKKKAIQHLGREAYGIKINDDVIRTNWGRPIRDLFKVLFKDVAVDDIDKIIEKYTKVRINFPTRPYPDTVSTLRNLSPNFLLGIITSNRRDFLNFDLNLSGIEQELFFLIQTAEEGKAHKPDPHVFDYAVDILSKQKINKSEILYVGDTLIDYFAARDAGLQFYGIPDRTVNKQEFDKVGARTITGLSNLIELV